MCSHLIVLACIYQNFHFYKYLPEQRNTQYEEYWKFQANKHQVNKHLFYNLVYCKLSKIKSRTNKICIGSNFAHEIYNFWQMYKTHKHLEYCNTNILHVSRTLSKIFLFLCQFLSLRLRWYSLIQREKIKIWKAKTMPWVINF